MRKNVFLLVLILAFLIVQQTAAQDAAPPAMPLIIPLQNTPGPDTWLVGQFYGNTVDAFNYGEDWYAAGQDLHFGVDLYTPCGTPVLAAADGVVIAVDDPGRGSPPHNLAIVHHDLGIVTLYGHLLDTPPMEVDDYVVQGQIVAYSGEPQGACTSRPHLHFEVRGINDGTVRNPVNYINAPWHTLASIGPLTRPLFQQDLAAPIQWTSVEDQPVVHFWQPALNDYPHTLPMAWEQQPPVNVLPERVLGDLAPETQWALQPLSGDGCCANAWWHPVDSERLYAVDKLDQLAYVVEWQISSGQPATLLEPAPRWTSPDGQFNIHMFGRQAQITDAAGTVISTIDTAGSVPAISADNSRILWRVADSEFIPNEHFPLVEFWVSNLDGSNPRMIWSQEGGQAQWLDESRILIESPFLQRTDTTLYVYNTADDTHYTLGWWNWMRQITVAPGGDRLMFYLMWQEDPTQSGIYTIRTEPGAVAEQLPFFGDWRWRDSESVYYIPFNYSAGNQHILAYYHLGTRQIRYLTDPATLPFTIANGDWAVSADGRHISFRNAQDGKLWMLTIQ